MIIGPGASSVKRLLGRGSTALPEPSHPAFFICISGRKSRRERPPRSDMRPVLLPPAKFGSRSPERRAKYLRLCQRLLVDQARENCQRLKGDRDVKRCENNVDDCDEQGSGFEACGIAYH